MNNHSAGVSQFLDEILKEELAHPAYHHTLWQFLDQGSGSAVEVSLKTLPLLSCTANGGDPLAAIPVAAWQVIHRAAKLFDDVEDGEAGHPAQTLNAGTGLLFVAHLALSQLPAQQARPISQALNQAVLRSCAGQHADLAAGPTQTDPETWLDIARTKSGSLLAWATWAGTWLAGVVEPTLAGYARYGSHLGILHQVADDFNGVWGAEGVSDLASGHLSLPVCYALSILKGQDRNDLITLLEQAVGGDKTAEETARQQLIDLGAQRYLLVVGRLHRQEALAAVRLSAHDEALHSLKRASPQRQQALVTLLNQVLPGSEIKRWP